MVDVTLSKHRQEEKKTMEQETDMKERIYVYIMSLMTLEAHVYSFDNIFNKDYV